MPAAAEDTKSQSGKQSNEAQLKAFSNVVFRCVVFQSKPGECTAECVDLDMLTKAATSHDALRGLKQAMQGYLYVALNRFLHEQGAYASFAIVMAACFGFLAVWCIRLLVNGKQGEIDRIEPPTGTSFKNWSSSIGNQVRCQRTQRKNDIPTAWAFGHSISHV